MTNGTLAGRKQTGIELVLVWFVAAQFGFLFLFLWLLWLWLADLQWRKTLQYSAVQYSLVLAGLQ